MYEMYPDTWRLSDARRVDARESGTTAPHRRPRKQQPILPEIISPAGPPNGVATG